MLRSRSQRWYSIGDSHSGSLGRNGITVLHLGPVTAYRAGRDGELTRLISRRLLRSKRALWPSVVVRLAVRRNDCVLLFFGEIDVRAHFAQQVPTYGSSERLSEILAERLVHQAGELSRRTGAKVGIANVVPPARFAGDPEMPTRGSIEERAAWTKALNMAFADRCRAHDIPFVDTHTFYADPAGCMQADVGDGLVHIRQDKADRIADQYKRVFANGG
jgi:hypothetical protein